MYWTPIQTALRWSFLLVCLTVVWPQALHAQNTPATEFTVAPVTHTYYIQNARIVQAPGRVLEQGAVLIRDGLIEAVGANVPIPFDARVIPGDSLTVYAGFIDGLSHAGLPQPKRETRPEKVPRPGDPPNDKAGIQPDRDVRTLIKPDDTSIKALRDAGFTAAHVVPHGQMLPGSGAVVLLAGNQVQDMVVQGRSSLFAQFTGARQMYPATSMGILAKWRNLYHQATQRSALAQRYTTDPTGLPRPAYDPVHEALFPVVAGTQPVMFHADDALDARRAISLSKELGFKLLLGDLKEGWWLTDALGDIPLFLSLDLPKKVKDAQKDSVQNAPVRTPNHAATSTEADQLKKAQAAMRARHETQAATLKAEGFRFGFSTLSTKPKDVRANLQRIIGAGLSEADALAALTTDAAALLGLDRRMGSVDAGKMANLVVTTGPYFDEKTKIRHVFIDGKPFTYEIKPDKPKNDDSVTATGTWAFDIETEQGPVTGTLVLQDDLSGTFFNSFTGETTSVESANLDGNQLTFTTQINVEGQAVPITVTATFEGDAISGSVDVPGQGVYAFEGTRSSDPQ